MPLYAIDAIQQDTLLGIWKMTSEETIDLLQRKLPKYLTANLTTFKSLRRKKEWIATRMLLRHMLGNWEFAIYYNESGKPFLKHNLFKHISITHSKEFVAIILHKNKPVGIDIETVHPRILKIVSKFLSEKEQNKILEHNASLQYYMLYWCAKEALYKLYSNKKLNFKQEIAIHSEKDFSSKLSLMGTIRQQSFYKKLPLYWQIMENNILVYAIDQCIIHN